MGHSLGCDRLKKMDHFKVYDSASSPIAGRTLGGHKRSSVNRPKTEAPAKVSIEKGDSSKPQAPENLVKLPAPARKLTDAQIRAKVAAHQESSAVTAAPKTPAAAKVPTSSPANDTDSSTANVTQKVELPQSDLAKNDPSDPVTQHKLRSLISNGGFNFSPGERKVLEGILGSKP